MVEGRENILSEFRKYIHEGDIGDTFMIMCQLPDDNLNAYGPYVQNPFFKIGSDNQQGRLELRPFTRFTIVDKRSYAGIGTEITATFEGMVEWHGPSSSTNDTGNVYLTWTSGDYYDYVVYPYLPSGYNIVQHNATGEIILGMSQYDVVNEPRAYMNYESKS